MTGPMTPMSGSYAPLALDQVVWGRPITEAVLAEIDQRGAARALIVTSPGVRRSVAAIETLARDNRVVGIFDAIEPHVPRGVAMALRAALVATDADLVVTIGGGSAIDSVKVALAMLSAGIEDGVGLDRIAIGADRHGDRPDPVHPFPLRQIVVPTTLSGAEYSDLAGCVDPASTVKQLFTGRWIGAASVIMAPEATLGTPLDLWLSTGIRALDHAIESVCSTVVIPSVDALSTSAIGLLASSLVRTLADPADLSARLDSQHGAWMACAGLNRVPWGASHGIGHQLGAVARIPHGYCSCVLLPAVLAYNRPVNADRQRQVEAALGAGTEASTAVRDLIARLGLPTRLRDVGVSRKMLPEIARTCLGNMFVRQNPRPIESPEQAMTILESAF